MCVGALLLSQMLVSCAARSHAPRAHLGLRTPAGEVARPYVYFTAPTGNYQWGVHSLGSYETHRAYSFDLAEMSGSRVVIQAADLVLVDTHPGAQSPSIEIVSGHVHIDAGNKVLTVKLQTRDGPFWANGEYPLSVTYQR